MSKIFPKNISFWEIYFISILTGCLPGEGRAAADDPVGFYMAIISVFGGISLSRKKIQKRYQD
ncbi:MAG: hypothetical protein U9N32_07375 [Spirochaetota bacterium]|nr:hypothetical protein [Spirochaetota bacterium]